MGGEVSTHARSFTLSVCSHTLILHVPSAHAHSLGLSAPLPLKEGSPSAHAPSKRSCRQSTSPNTYGFPFISYRLVLSMASPSWHGRRTLSVHLTRVNRLTLASSASYVSSLRLSPGEIATFLPRKVNDTQVIYT